MEDGTIMTADQIIALLKEKDRLKEENEILKKASKFFEELKNE